jgi:hypothetical protein
LSNVDYETFADLTAGINDGLNRVATEYKNELATPNPQNFELEKANLLALYSSPLKFPVSTSVYPLGKRTLVSHCRVFSIGLGI